VKSNIPGNELQYLLGTDVTCCGMKAPTDSHPREWYEWLHWGRDDGPPPLPQGVGGGRAAGARTGAASAQARHARRKASKARPQAMRLSGGKTAPDTPARYEGKGYGNGRKKTTPPRQ